MHGLNPLFSMRREDRHRRSKIRKKRKRSVSSSRAAKNISDFTDDLLELVLLCLGSPVCLIRAASTCKRWRRLIADAAFLRRFRSVHPPAVVGTYNNNHSYDRVPSLPRFEPAPSLSPTIDGGYLSLDFLCGVPSTYSSTERWTVNDSRGSLLLLYRQQIGNSRWFEYQWQRGMFVCEPLTQRYSKRIGSACPFLKQTQSFLLNGAGGGDDDTDLANFRILAFYNNGTAGMFSSKSWSWRRFAVENRRMHHLGFAAGSIYFHTYRRTVYSLDVRPSEDGEDAESLFSRSLLPQDQPWRDADTTFAVTTSRDDGNARVLLLGAGQKNLVILKRSGAYWAVERSIQLSAVMFGVSSSYEDDWGCRLPRSFPSVETVDAARILVSSERGEPFFRHFVNLDIKTMEVTTDSTTTDCAIKLPWPPTLRACTGSAI